MPPRVLPAPKLLRVLSGRTLDLPCVAHGDPVPTLSWFKDGRSLRVGDQDFLAGPDGTLKFADVRVSDSGRYRCVAANGAGEDAIEFTVEVMGECWLRVLAPW